MLTYAQVINMSKRRTAIVITASAMIIAIICLLSQYFISRDQVKFLQTGIDANFSTTFSLFVSELLQDDLGENQEATLRMSEYGFLLTRLVSLSSYGDKPEMIDIVHILVALSSDQRLIVPEALKKDLMYLSHDLRDETRIRNVLAQLTPLEG
ncbi:MAG: hypothetical protein RR053_05045 [Evtepia sp.]